MPMSACLRAGGIIHTVAGHRHHLAVGLEGLHQLQFLGRCHPGKHVHPIHACGDAIRTQCRQLAAIDRRQLFTLTGRSAADAHLAGDGPSGFQVVAGDHLHRDACRLAGRHGPDRLGTGRIQHPLQTKEIEILGHMVVFQLELRRPGLADGKGEHPLPTGGHSRHGRLHRRSVQGLGPAPAIELTTAAIEHGFHRALEQNALAAVKGGHELLL